MYNGGVTINQRTAQIIRFSGLMVPVLLMFYGMLVQYDIVSTTHYVNNLVFFSVMVPWTILAIYQFLYESKNAFESGFRLTAYHLLSAAYILFVAGFVTPFVATWILLFLASYAYFSNKGLKLSIIALILTAAADSILHIGDGSILLVILLALSSVLMVGIAAVSISQIQEVDGAELTKSKAQESLQRDRILTIVNNLADAVLSTDKNGVIRVYNAASLNLLDTNRSLNGHHIDEILKLYDQNDKPIELFENFKNAKSVVVRDDLTFTVEGETSRLEVTYSPIRSGFSKARRSQNQDGYIIILRDVTKSKSLEEERDEFISVVSHELRTPITIAEGTISNVQVMMERPDIAENILKEGIKTAHDQVIYLSKMVNDLSTLSRAERGVADNPEPIDVRSLVDDLYNEYAPQAEKRALHFNLDLTSRLGQVTASRLYLKELLQNFITNSLKYTKEGTITLHVTRKEKEVTFEVKDTGIGISKSDQAKIFNKFYRSEDYRTRETGGTGLGLYVALKLAKKLNTKIELTSRLNHGSSFSITLPVEDK
ncbi:MAG TPA: ATP-binding protein [Candidatus Saccharimonadales bacterium]|nr:ATP-binding protein [Candidatus Saccharimonadales bacterium]